MNQYSPVRASCAARFARSSTHEMARNQRSMFVRYKLAATGKKLKLREGIVLLIARGHYILLLSFPIIAVDSFHIYVRSRSEKEALEPISNPLQRNDNNRVPILCYTYICYFTPSCSCAPQPHFLPFLWPDLAL